MMVNFALVFVFMLALSGTVPAVSGQNINNCKKLLDNEGQRVEYHCSCMEQLVQMGEPIYKLVINQTDCATDVALTLNWKMLQTYIKLKVIVFDGALITFENSVGGELKNCSLAEVIFLNSTFIKIPSDAFNGLKVMETIRFVESDVGVIESKSFTGFHRLKIIEFANTNITEIEPEAFTDLPLIDQVSFYRSHIVKLASNGIHILLPPQLPSDHKCPVRSRGRSSARSLMNEMSGRNSDYLQNVSLPQYGSKLMFFSSDIGVMASNSINTNAFSFVIFGGNTIGVMRENAIKSEIKNECDISAILVIQNDFNRIESGVFLNVIGDENYSDNTVIGLTNNVFNKVHSQGFVINSKLNTQFVRNNEFNCDCDQLTWVLTEDDSEAQILLLKELLNTGNCTDGQVITDALKDCASRPDVDRQDVTTKPFFAPTVLKTNDTNPCSFKSLGTRISYHRILILFASFVISILNLSFYIYK